MTRRQLVLHLLREAGDRGVTSGEFLRQGCGSRYGGRIFELREQGHVIEAERIREGAWLYTLTHDAADDAGRPDLSEPPPSAAEQPDDALLAETASSVPQAAPPCPLFEMPDSPARPSFYDPEEDEAA